VSLSGAQDKKLWSWNVSLSGAQDKELNLVPHLKEGEKKKVITFVLTQTHTQKQLKAVVTSRFV
jgi:hypothetical protein